MPELGEEEEQAWRQLCSEIGADFVAEEKGLLRLRYTHHKVVAKVDKWRLTLDTSVSSGAPGTRDTFTRIRAPYLARDRFWVSVTKGVGCLGCLWGCSLMPLHVIGLAIRARKPNVDVGYPELQQNFYIMGNDKSKVRALFANARIRQLIQSQPFINLRVERAWKLPSTTGGFEWVSRLRFEEKGVITDVERLKSLFELFGETLNQLCLIGSASREELDLESIPASRRFWFE